MATVAIIGAGPAGFYALKALRRERPDLDVDLFERLKTPFGLLRSGVAPDHQHIKRIAEGFTRLVDERVRFFGNIELGRDLKVSDLDHDAVIWTTGCMVARRLALPGSDLPGVFGAAEVVYWYNHHPDYRALPLSLDGVRNAAIIGNGNVALDVARILVRSVDDLAATDISDPALEVLRASTLEALWVIGRRGPWQAAYGAPELRGLRDLSSMTVHGEIGPRPPEADRRQERICAVLSGELPRHGKPVHLRFLASPTRYVGTDRVQAIELVRNRLEAGQAVPTGVTEQLPVDLVIEAVGYRGVPIEGLPFDARRGTIPHVDGRVQRDGAHFAPHYVAGWAKRGPSGVIGSNRPDAEATVRAVLEDLDSHTRPRRDVAEVIRARGISVVRWADWLRLDAAEVAAGQAAGRPRIKLA